MAAAAYPDQLAAIRDTDPDLYGRLDWLVDEIGACWTRSRYRAIRAEHRGTLDQLASRYPAVQRDHGAQPAGCTAAVGVTCDVETRRRLGLGGPPGRAGDGRPGLNETAQEVSQMRIARVERFAAAALSGICADYTRYTLKVDIAADAKRAMLYALALEREMDRIEEREQRRVDAEGGPDGMPAADQGADDGSDGIQ